MASICPITNKECLKLKNKIGIDKKLYCDHCFDSDSYLVNACENLMLFDAVEVKALILRKTEAATNPQLKKIYNDTLRGLSPDEIDRINEINSQCIEEDYLAQANSEYLDRFAKKVLSSDHFSHLFSNGMPKGENDKEYGIDYIPFLLSNIKIRRDRLSRNSNIYLISTITLGIMFTTILFFFGFTIINESFLGDNQRLDSIEAQTARLNSNFIKFQDFEKDILATKQYQDISNRIDKLINVRSRLNTDEDRTKVKNAKNLFELNDVGSEDFLQALTNFRNAARDQKNSQELNPQERASASEYEANLRAITMDFRSLLINDNLASSILEKVIKDNTSVIEEVRKFIADNDVGYEELLKRIAIGIIVAGFFLSILKYTSNLYFSHLKELIRTEDEDLSLRKFYIALKLAQKSETIDNEFIKNTLFSRPDSNVGHAENSSEDYKTLIEEIVFLIQKLLSKK